MVRYGKYYGAMLSPASGQLRYTCSGQAHAGDARERTRRASELLYDCGLGGQPGHQESSRIELTALSAISLENDTLVYLREYGTIVARFRMPQRSNVFHAYFLRRWLLME